MQRLRQQAGLSLVEVIIGVALLAVILVVISQLISLYLGSVRATQDSLVATYYAESVLETARSIRDADWSTFAALPLDTLLYPEYTVSTATFTTTNPDPAAAYQAEVHIRAVYRDSGSDELRSSTDSGTYVDSAARVVEVEVYKDGESMVTQSSLLTNLFES